MERAALGFWKYNIKYTPGHEAPTLLVGYTKQLMSWLHSSKACNRKLRLSCRRSASSKEAALPLINTLMFCWQSFSEISCNGEKLKKDQEELIELYSTTPC
ncbi:MAG: hypothetical protein ACTS73_04940 [Arsenophonus sp. NEOnobi-MAG3]